jgi:hypothetical protein
MDVTIKQTDFVLMVDVDVLAIPIAPVWLRTTSSATPINAVFVITGVAARAVDQPVILADSPATPEMGE